MRGSKVEAPTHVMSSAPKVHIAWPRIATKNNSKVLESKDLDEVYVPELDEDAHTLVCSQPQFCPQEQIEKGEARG